jgi:hypothetical protein
MRYATRSTTHGTAVTIADGPEVALCEPRKRVWARLARISLGHGLPPGQTRPTDDASHSCSRFTLPKLMRGHQIIPACCPEYFPINPLSCHCDRLPPLFQTHVSFGELKSYNARPQSKSNHAVHSLGPVYAVLTNEKTAPVPVPVLVPVPVPESAEPEPRLQCYPQQPSRCLFPPRATPPRWSRGQPSAHWHGSACPAIRCESLAASGGSNVPRWISPSSTNRGGPKICCLLRAPSSPSPTVQ